MRKAIKYTSMWTFFWLQMYLIFLHFNSLMNAGIFTVCYQLGAILYVGLFLTYQVLFTSLKMSDTMQKKFERIILVAMLLLTIAYSYYIFGNYEWLLSDQADLRSIFVEVSWPIALIFSTGATLYLSLQEKNMINMNDKKLWNTYNTLDIVFLVALSVLLVILAFSSTKLIPGLRREYHQLLRTALNIIIITVLWNYSRYFMMHRKNYYAALVGFGNVFLLEMLLFFVYIKPSNFLLLEEVSTKITVTSVIYIATAILIFGWIVFISKKEKTKK